MSSSATPVFSASSVTSEQMLVTANLNTSRPVHLQTGDSAGRRRSVGSKGLLPCREGAC